METLDSAAILFTSLPPSALVGVDLFSFTTTPRFRGVRGLSPGLHFAFAGTSIVLSERHGLWFQIENDAEKSISIAKWLAQDETLLPETDPTERMRWRANIGEYWRSGLTSYRYLSTSPATEDIDDWPALTSHITTALLSRVLVGDAWSLSSGSSAQQDIEAIPGLDTMSNASSIHDRVLHLLAVDLKQTWPPGATGRERSEAAQDRSWALLNLSTNLNEILGEMQFCFIMLLTLNNFSCLEQWKRILELILTSKSAVSKHADFFVRALALLRLQLQHCKDAEGGLIDLADESSSLLGALLDRFRKGIENQTKEASAAMPDVLDELDDLEGYLHHNHGWQFGGQFARSGILELDDGEQVRALTTAYDEDDELGEYAPQVVELTAKQMEFLGMEASVAGQDVQGLGNKTDWGVRRSLGMTHGTYVENRSIENHVVENEDSDEDIEPLRAGSAESEQDEDEDEEEMQDLDEMDARY